MRNIRKLSKISLSIGAVIIYIILSYINSSTIKQNPMQHIAVINNSEANINGSILKITYDNQNYIPIKTTISQHTAGIISNPDPNKRIIGLSVQCRHNPSEPDALILDTENHIYTNMLPNGNLLKIRLYCDDNTKDIYRVDFTDDQQTSRLNCITAINSSSTNFTITGTKYRPDVTICRPIKPITIPSRTCTLLTIPPADFEDFCYDEEPEIQKKIQYLDYNSEQDGGIVGVEMSNSGVFDYLKWLFRVLLMFSPSAFAILLIILLSGLINL